MAKKNLHVDRDFQTLFLRSPLGPKVLGKIVDEVGLLDIASDEEMQIAQNEVKIILARCGIGLGMPGEKYVKALMGHKAEKALEPDVEEEQD